MSVVFKLFHLTGTPLCVTVFGTPRGNVAEGETLTHFGSGLKSAQGGMRSLQDTFPRLNTQLKHKNTHTTASRPVPPPSMLLLGDFFQQGMDAHFDDDFLSRAGEMTQQVKGTCHQSDGLSLIPSTQVRGVKAYKLSPDFLHLSWHMHT